ncbi:Asp23/Gls24 family envelope stress response protein [Acetilactobacillus jinshanensis]|uniref:Asp23/Gls24 family envelope stress response protein n=1 Tax=Acetilactobacillus jinshanensis TaxID=1720083 RepID=A0A4P6ZLE9_9LACO|nr:Asp23/Gls24 family envelope stress response protein [Acetilactobacillus jinshanensis]QBP18636.1 Asp23/Gls24 family envelope stress response protein [Acetilactobacillus jinshanensis]URL61512.1 Asp23/Gls24 family envelope stress response protein [uncultured bacterium]
MAEDVNITLKSGQSSLGKIKIAPRVLEIIASIAAVQVKGVNRMRGSLATSVNELFGHREWGKGIRLAFNKHHELIVDIYVYINYGYSVPKVALQIQDKVKQQLLFMTELNVGTVNVHVEGIVPKKKTSHVDPNHLFKDNQGEQN